MAKNACVLLQESGTVLLAAVQSQDCGMVRNVFAPLLEYGTERSVAALLLVSGMEKIAFVKNPEPGEMVSADVLKTKFGLSKNAHVPLDFS